MTNTTSNQSKYLYENLGWSHDNLAELLDVSRPKAKQLITGEKQPNQLQSVLLNEIAKQNLSHKQYSINAKRAYRLQLIRNSDDE